MLVRCCRGFKKVEHVDARQALCEFLPTFRKQSAEVGASVVAGGWCDSNWLTVRNSIPIAPVNDSNLVSVPTSHRYVVMNSALYCRGAFYVTTHNLPFKDATIIISTKVQSSDCKIVSLFFHQTVL